MHTILEDTINMYVQKNWKEYVYNICIYIYRERDEK